MHIVAHPLKAYNFAFDEHDEKVVEIDTTFSCCGNYASSDDCVCKLVDHIRFFAICQAHLFHDFYVTCFMDEVLSRA